MHSAILFQQSTHILVGSDGADLAMEEVTLTQEQLEALAASGVGTTAADGTGGELVYTYVAADAVDGAVQQQQQVVEGGAVVVNEGEQQQIEEGQEVYVFDEETGEYQKCVYVQQQSADGSKEVDVQALINAAGGLVPAAVEGEEGSPQVVSYVIQEGEEGHSEEAAANDEQVTTERSDGGSQQEQVAEGERFVVQCGKCGQNFEPEDFETHFRETHGDAAEQVEEVAAKESSDQSSDRVVIQCGECSRTFDAENFDAHFEEAHGGATDSSRNKGNRSDSLSKKNHSAHIKVKELSIIHI